MINLILQDIQKATEARKKQTSADTTQQTNTGGPFLLLYRGQLHVY